MNNANALSPSSIDRRAFLQAGAAGVAGLALSQLTGAVLGAEDKAAQMPTTFRIACMTLPYSNFPLQRALEGIKNAGYNYVAWGTSHREQADAKDRSPVMASDAPPEKARELGQRCRDMGLEPVMMFAGVYPEHEKGLEIHINRIKQASAARLGQVLTFGHTKGSNDAVWIERFKKLGPIARDHGVIVVVKQHGGNTGTGEACAKIVEAVNDEGIWVNFDSGNVMDYLNLDPIPDIQKCAKWVRSFCIKDHRDWPNDEDCGPGLGEIDHYRLLHPVAHTGLTIPLACENIFAPLLPRPTAPEGVDTMARRAREFLETVVTGLGAKVR